MLPSSKFSINNRFEFVRFQQKKIPWQGKLQFVSKSRHAEDVLRVQEEYWVLV